MLDTIKDIGPLLVAILALWFNAWWRSRGDRRTQNSETVSNATQQSRLNALKMCAEKRAEMTNNFRAQNERIHQRLEKGGEIMAAQRSDLSALRVDIEVIKTSPALNGDFRRLVQNVDTLLLRTGGDTCQNGQNQARR